MFPLICLLVYNSTGEMNTLKLSIETVTFLHTDIEGSTRLWEKQPEAMQIALARHGEILLAAVKQHGGIQVKTTGDCRISWRW
jgi:class 3 adenylate cyclase